MSLPAHHDFNPAILDETAHRPWPMPDGPWIMTQTWHDLLFAHWPVDAGALRAKLPAGLELDQYDGRAWLGIVPFYMTNVAPRGVPALPWVSAFPELNVRTYVRVGGQAGVYFFSLDASNVLAVATARTLFHLPYFAATMSVDERADGWITYESRRGSAGEHGARAEFTGRYRPIGPPAPPQAGTLDYFLTERYCLFTVDSAGRTLRVDIHHPPWPLQPAEAELTKNTMADAAGIGLPATPPLLHFSRRQDMVGWRPMRVPGGSSAHLRRPRSAP
jgi:uncharacterized protein YqjF (DUF2071 family)